MFDAAGIDVNLMSKPVPTGTPAGTLTPEAARAVGLSESVTVVSISHDQVAAAVGAGAFDGEVAVDGAGTVRCYFQIVLPVCRPVIGAAVALSFADCWNLVEQPMTYLNQRLDLQPLSVMFNQLVESSSGIEFAGAALYILPALLIYLFFQEDILAGIQLTEMK